MRNLNRDNNAMKNIVSGVLLVGGLAVGIVGASIIARASESTSLNAQKTVRNKSVDSKQNALENTMPVLETEEDLAKLVMEKGNQVMVDEETGKMYLAYLNENNKVEIVEVSQDELNDLINQVSRISNIDENNDSQGGYIPREYLRGISNQEQKIEKVERKQLNSEEGRQAVERAKQHKKSNK